MREAGVKVLTVRDVMAYGVGDHSAHAARLAASAVVPRGGRKEGYLRAWALMA